MKEKLLLIVFFLGVMSLHVLGHCDTRNGPVVMAAREALKTGNINYVLVWVSKKDEAEVKDAFRQTLEVRKLNPTLQKWAENYFFETVVRIHRLGEGETYTGIKDVTVPEKTVLSVDSALERQAVEQILQLLESSLQKSLKDKFYSVLAKKNYDPDNVEAGRIYIKKYIELLHYVEAVYTVSNTGQLLHAVYEPNTGISTEKTGIVTVNGGIGRTEQEKSSLSNLAVLIILAGLALIILIQVLFSSRKRNQKKISHDRRYRNSLHHTKEKSRVIGN